MEIRIRVVRVYIGSEIKSCLLINDVIIDVFHNIVTRYDKCEVIGKIVASNRYGDIGMYAWDIFNLARQIGLEIP